MNLNAIGSTVSAVEFSAVMPNGTLVYFFYHDCVGIATPAGARWLRLERLQNHATASKVKNELVARLTPLGWDPDLRWVNCDEERWQYLEEIVAGTPAPPPAPLESGIPVALQAFALEQGFQP